MNTNHSPSPPTLRLILTGVALLTLGGCTHWNEYRGIPAGGDAVLWRPDGAPKANFEAQIALPSDLTQGRGTSTHDAQNAANAIDRLRHDRSVPLPASSISSMGQASTSAGGQP